MISKYKLVIAEDHTIVRVGLRVLLSKERDLEITGEADNSDDVFRLVEEKAPDLVIMGFSIEGGDAQTIQRIKEHHAQTQVLVLTQHKSEESIREALQAGATGYLLKDVSKAELIIAVRNVLAGKVYLSPSISDKVINLFLVGNSVPEPKSHINLLTERERQVLKMVAGGSTNKHIAEYLQLSVKTVDKHRSNLMRKLDLHNVSALTAYAIGQGLVNGPVTE